jgi:hypothetical protein
MIGLRRLMRVDRATWKEHQAPSYTEKMDSRNPENGSCGSCGGVFDRRFTNWLIG